MIRPQIPHYPGRKPHGYCEICTVPLYSKGDTMLTWGQHATNSSIGDIVIARRCRNEAECAARCSEVNWDKVVREAH